MSAPVETEGALPASAQKAWLAYQAMSESKQAYFSVLNALDRKEREREQPTMAEKLHLEALLKRHDEKVKRFSEAMAAITEPGERVALLNKLSVASADQ